ncbi:hypothetical protein CCOS191_3907 [Pseudomonas sp. CCOS 191]|nr:hypothetical protein CCOS191_3907 [Pseudomonas sp. CCOS 191]
MDSFYYRTLATFQVWSVEPDLETIRQQFHTGTIVLEFIIYMYPLEKSLQQIDRNPEKCLPLKVQRCFRIVKLHPAQAIVLVIPCLHQRITKDIRRILGESSLGKHLVGEF